MNLMINVIYYFVCMLLWVAVWIGTYFVISQFRRRDKGTIARRMFPMALGIAAILLTYVLAYAPAIQLLRGSRAHIFLDLFVPVEWLIDNTPIQSIYAAWADVFGVKGTILSAANWRGRVTYWGHLPQWNYVSWWLIFGLSALLVPPWLFRKFLIPHLTSPQLTWQFRSKR